MMQSVGVITRHGRVWRGVGGYRRCASASNSASLISQARERLAGLGEGEVTLEKDVTSGVAEVTLRNAKRRNALSGHMMVQLADIAQELDNWQEGKAVILKSEGDYFCSGGDLTTVRAISNPKDGLLMTTLMHDTLTSIYTLPLITLTLVNGPAIGGGAELTTSTDFRVFSESGSVCFVHGKMGVATGWGGGTRLTRLVRQAAALDLLTTCRKVDGIEAQRIGLADFVVSVEERDRETRDWLDLRIAHEPEIVQGLKRISVGGRDLPLHSSLADERKVFVSLWGGPANLKALGKNIKHK